MRDFQRKCPHCGGDLLRSRSHQSGYTSYFWKKPWKSGLFDFGVERMYPWACMSCGVVLFYLERLPSIAEEYKTAGDREETAHKVAPAPLKTS